MTFPIATVSVYLLSCLSACLETTDCDGSTSAQRYYWVLIYFYFQLISDQFLGSYVCSSLTFYVKTCTCPALVSHIISWLPNQSVQLLCVAPSRFSSKLAHAQLVTQLPQMQKNLSDGTQKNVAKRSSLSPPPAGSVTRLKTRYVQFSVNSV